MVCRQPYFPVTFLSLPYRFLLNIDELAWAAGMKSETIRLLSQSQLLHSVKDS